MNKGYVTAILLAAGESTRMRESKALLSWRGKYLIEYQIASLITCGVKEVLVVLGHEASMITDTIKLEDRTRIVVNENYKSGKSSSVITGLQNIPTNAGDILILAVDQPRTPNLLIQLMKAHKRNTSKITIPVFQNRGGHPIIFPNALLTQMMRIDESTEGLRYIVNNNSELVNRWETQNPEVLIDVNTMQSYTAAREAI